jgi:hypothetical protein
MNEAEQYTKDDEVETPSLTKWEKEPTLLELKQDLTESRNDHDTQVSTVDGYLDNLNITGKAKVNTAEGRSKVVPKLIRKQAEWRYAALSEPFLSTAEMFQVSPVTWEDKAGSIQNQLLLNNQFNTRMKKVKFIDEYVRTGVDEGTIICRVGWEFEEEKYEEVTDDYEFVVNPEYAPLHAELAQMKKENPGEYYSEVPDELQEAHETAIASGEPIQAVLVGSSKKELTRTLKNYPTAEVCDYRNVIIDPTCNGDIDKAGFVIYSFESSLSQLKKDGKYKNLDRIVVSNASPLAQSDHATDNESNFTFADKPRQKMVVHEYWGFWDIDGSGIVKPIVAAWVGDTMIRMEENPFPDQKLPFVIVQYLPKRKAIHGEPDGALLEDNQKILGATMRGMIDIMGRSANGQVGTRKDALDAVNKRRFRNGQDYEYNGNVDPRLGMFMHTYPEIPNSAQFMLQQQNQEADSLTGVQSFSQGVSGEAMGDVAAGVRGALDAASKRELGILRRLSAGIVEIGRKFISMNAEFLDEEEVVRITNDEFVAIRRDDLAGEYDLKLSISTAEEDDNKAKEMAFMLQTLGNKVDFSIVLKILINIARLRKMPDLVKELEEYEPKPDPFEEEKQKLELELLRAQIEETKSKAVENNAEARLDMSKAQETGAKAENLQSDTDKKNLDYVEQESGVTQERDLQKSGEQARSQGKLKLLDHELDKQDEDRKELKSYLNRGS